MEKKTPIELLRELFGFMPEVDDYEMVRSIYEEATLDRRLVEGMESREREKGR